MNSHNQVEYLKPHRKIKKKELIKTLELYSMDPEAFLSFLAVVQLCGETSEVMHVDEMLERRLYGMTIEIPMRRIGGTLTDSNYESGQSGNHNTIVVDGTMHEVTNRDLVIVGV